MRSFIVILGLIVCGSAVMISAMNQDLPIGTSFFIAYSYIYSQFISDPTLIQNIMEIFFPFILNVVFLNMLVNLMGKTFESISAKEKYSDLKEKLTIIIDTLLVLRFFSWKKSQSKKQFLLYCHTHSYETKEIEEISNIAKTNNSKRFSSDESDEIYRKIEKLEMELVNIKNKINDVEKKKAEDRFEPKINQTRFALI